jgi:hypothetical protein
MGEWVNGGEDFVNSYIEIVPIEIVCENCHFFHPFTYFSPLVERFDLNIISQLILPYSSIFFGVLASFVLHI